MSRRNKIIDLILYYNGIKLTGFIIEIFLINRRLDDILLYMHNGGSVCVLSVNDGLSNESVRLQDMYGYYIDIGGMGSLYLTSSEIDEHFESAQDRRDRLIDLVL